MDRFLLLPHRVRLQNIFPSFSMKIAAQLTGIGTLQFSMETQTSVYSVNELDFKKIKSRTEMTKGKLLVEYK